MAQEVEPSTLRAVVISHLHPDHFVDLVALRHYLRWDFTPPRRVRVIAPAGLEQRLDALLDEPGFTAEVFDVEPLSEGSRRAGSFTLEARQVLHTDESYAFRVSTDSGRGIVYSGDCGRADDLRPLIHAGDVLLSEVSFGLGPVIPGAEHLAAPDVGRLAAETAVRQVILTHLLMGHDREATVALVARLSGAPVHLADPGDRFTINAP